MIHSRREAMGLSVAESVHGSDWRRIKAGAGPAERRKTQPLKRHRGWVVGL